MVDLDLMDGNALREFQAPFKKQYRDMTDAGLITLKAQESLGEEYSRGFCLSIQSHHSEHESCSSGYNQLHR
jgi:hypothetical protein